MQCPGCFAEMEEENHRGVQLDLCSRCRGVWFDGGELTEYQNGKGGPTLVGVPDPGSPVEPSGDTGVRVKCPGCGHDILRSWTIDKHPVMRCTTCGGVFLTLPEDEEDQPRNDNVLAAAIAALEEIVPWLLGRDRDAGK